MAKQKRNGIIEIGEIRPESNNTGYDEVRPAHLSHRRECYGTLERRELPRTFITRFHTKYQTADGCWLWQAGKYPKGYGMVSLGRDFAGKQHTEYAHRVAYVIAKGNIPQGAVVRHSCDNPPCVNPEHLVLGTQADNVNDARVQGHYNRPHVNGRKLTDAQVDEVLASSEPSVRLAERFHVSKGCISQIRRGIRRKVA